MKTQGKRRQVLHRTSFVVLSALFTTGFGIMALGFAVSMLGGVPRGARWRSWPRLWA